MQLTPKQAYFIFGFNCPRDSSVSYEGWFIDCLRSIDAPIPEEFSAWAIYKDRYQNAEYQVMMKDRETPGMGFMVIFDSKHARQAMKFQLQYDVVLLDRNPFYEGIATQWLTNQ